MSSTDSSGLVAIVSAVPVVGVVIVAVIIVATAITAAASIRGGSRSSANKIAGSSTLLGRDPRLALARAVGLDDAASGRAVGGGEALAGDELRTAANADVLRAGLVLDGGTALSREEVAGVGEGKPGSEEESGDGKTDHFEGLCWVLF